MRVLVTRPIEDAERTAAALRARGHEAIVSPLMEIRFVDGAEVLLEDVQAILVTSANCVRALARRTSRRDLPVFAVGPQTTLAARAGGFADVRDADGDASDLAETASRWLDPRRGAVLHSVGRDRTGELAASLEAAGFIVRTEVLYQADTASALSREAEASLKNGQLDAVMLFSPRSAATLREIVMRGGWADACTSLVALCISAAAAAALQPLTFREIRAAKRPNQDSMLDLIAER